MQKLKFKTQDENRYGEIIHSGFLNKKSKGKIWHSRYVVLWEDMALRFYETEDRGNVIGKIKLKNVNEVKKLSYAQSTELDPNKPYFFSIFSNSLKKTWQFGTNNDDQLSNWIHILQSALTVRNNNKPSSQPINKYVGHHGHNMSNMEDFSVAQSMSSRASSIQSLSALAILSGGGGGGDDHDDEDPYSRPRHRSIINDAINEDEEEDDDEILDVEKTLNQENKNIVFEGYIERKTNQKVLGKHLWETRYFKLSTHSLSIYTNDKTNIAESIIKLSSIISVNRNTKNDGTDLKDNRFDINTRDQILNLRTENQMVCQQWIHFLSLERKKHRKSIRTGLESLEEVTAMRRRSTATTVDNSNTSEDHHHPPEPQEDKPPVRKASVRRFKRSRTSRYEDDRDKQDDDNNNNNDHDDVENDKIEDENSNDPINNGDHHHNDGDHDNDKKGDEKTKKHHTRKLSMKSWVNSVEQRHHESISYDAQQLKQMEREKKKNRRKKQKHNNLTETASFQGFLIRKIGHQNTKIGEKIYFRLSDDTLEFSKIEEILTKDHDDLNQLHSSNILGTISVEHIKSVKMISDGNDDEFIIVFDANDSKTDWILKTERNNKEDAIKWVNILQTAQKEAKDIANTINKIGTANANKNQYDSISNKNSLSNTDINHHNHSHDENETHDDDDEEDEDDDDTEDSSNTDPRTATTTRKSRRNEKKKKIGGSIKALQKND